MNLALVPVEFMQSYAFQQLVLISLITTIVQSAVVAGKWTAQATSSTVDLGSQAKDALQRGQPWEFASSDGQAIQGVDLRSLLVDLEEAKHHRRVVIRNAKVDGPFDISKTEFGFGIEFEKFEFRGDVDFRSSRFQRDLHFTDCTFQKAAQFQGMVVDGDFSVEGSIFKAGIAVSRAMIRGIFDADAVTSEDRSTFYNIVVERSIFLEGATFEQGLNLRDGRIGVDLDLSKANFAQTVDFRYAAVEGTIFISGTRFSPAENSLWIRGLDYRFLTSEPQTRSGMSHARDLQGSVEDLKAFVHRAEFSSDAYMKLAAHLESIGQAEHADEVYISMKSREREFLDWPAKLWNWFLFLSVGYGRRPARAFLWSVCIIIIGCIVFGRFGRRPHDMELIDPSKPVVPPQYGLMWCLLYSADIFVPAINLEAANVWRPAANRSWFVHGYVRLQRFLGWVLVPIAVAALSGLIGRGS
jgi:hypothetical protein